MLKRIFKIIKTIATVVGMVVMAFFFIAILVWGVDLDGFEYNENPLITSNNLHNEGPFVFENDSLFEAFYIGGNQKEGFYLRNEAIIKNTPTPLSCYYFPDSSSFNFEIQSTIHNPAAYHNIDGSQKILAISDIEGNFNTLRKFLINNHVVDNELNWIFGRNHLVFNGDMVDRGYFVHQVLWLIYKLDYQSQAAGGAVHYILGNHEIMNMQGNFRYAKSKYKYAASILDLQQIQLWDNTTVLGKWLLSKNVAETIGQYLFAHAGLHPDLMQHKLDIETINRVAKRSYCKPYFNLRNAPKAEKLIRSSQYGPYWYRGYFKENLKQETIDSIADFYQCEHIIVGHTVQGEVGAHWSGKIVAIDVLHPLDHVAHFPKRKACGLLIVGGLLYQIDENGLQNSIEF